MPHLENYHIPTIGRFLNFITNQGPSDLSPHMKKYLVPLLTDESLSNQRIKDLNILIKALVSSDFNDQSSYIKIANSLKKNQRPSHHRYGKELINMVYMLLHRDIVYVDKLNEIIDAFNEK